MKKILLLSAFAAIALVGRAQQVADSFIPLAGSKPVRLDGRGLVVDLPTGKQGRKP